MKNYNQPFKTAVSTLFVTFALLLAGCSTETDVAVEDKGSFTNMVKTELMPGGDIVRKKCSNCHFFDKKMRKVGPGLAGIYMSKPRSKGLPFDVWDDAALDAWLTDPVAIKSDTPMAIVGLKDPAVRAQVIEYLKKI